MNTEDERASNYREEICHITEKERVLRVRVTAAGNMHNDKTGRIITHEGT
jgi:hypothetical protein